MRRLHCLQKDLGCKRVCTGRGKCLLLCAVTVALIKDLYILLTLTYYFTLTVTLSVHGNSNTLRNSCFLKLAYGTMGCLLLLSVASILLVLYSVFLILTNFRGVLTTPMGPKTTLTHSFMHVIMDSLTNIAIIPNVIAVCTYRYVITLGLWSKYDIVDQDSRIAVRILEIMLYMMSLRCSLLTSHCCCYVPLLYATI